MKPNGKNRGLALINALVLVAALSAVTVLLLQKAQSARHRQALTQEVTQAQAYLDGIELFVISVLDQDRRDGAVDHLREGWAIGGGTVDIDRGTASYKITDLQGLFALSFLSGGDIVFGPEAFDNLMQSAGLKDSQATAIRAFVAQGGPSNPQIYTQQTPRIAPRGGTPVILPELRQVAGLTPADYDKIKGLIAAIQSPGTVNFNTAPPAVLRALLSDLPGSALNTLLEARRQTPFETVADLTAELTRKFGSKAEEPDSEIPELLANFGVSSQWFKAELVVTLGQTQLRRHVVFERSGETGKTKAKVRFADN